MHAAATSPPIYDGLRLVGHPHPGRFGIDSYRFARGDDGRWCVIVCWEHGVETRSSWLKDRRAAVAWIGRLHRSNRRKHDRIRGAGENQEPT